LAGMAYSLLVQSVFVVAVALVMLVRREWLSFGSLFYISRPTLTTLFKYGSSIQAINIIMIFFDPVTKYFITSAGSLNAVGYYEMANRLVIQVRNIITSTGQVLVPKVSQMRSSGNDSASAFVKAFFLQNTSIAICIAFGLLSSGWLISYIWLGGVVPDFLYAFSFMSTGWVFNIICAPAYYYFLGTGRLQPNLIQHLLFAIITVVCFAILPPGINAIMLFAVPAFALTAGAIYLVYQFIVHNRFRLNELVDADQQIMIVLYLAAQLLYTVSLAYTNIVLHSVIITVSAGLALIYFILKKRILFTIKSILGA
jgi:O-antigen/teichoic acid export membrane protein